MIRRMSLGALGAIASLSAVLSAPAQADVPMTVAQRYDNVRAVQTFADCVTTRFGSEAATVIRENLPNAQVVDDHRRLLSQRCASQAGLGSIRLAFPGAGFKYALGEGYVRAHHRDAGPTSFAEVPALSWAPVIASSDAQVAAMRPDWRAAYEARYARERDEYLMANMGECVARTNPAAVRDAALNTATVEAYRAAMQPLVATLQVCLPDGASVRIRPDLLRGASLYAYARMAMQLPGAGQ